MNKVEKKAVKRIHSLLDSLILNEPFNAEEFKRLKGEIISMGIGSKNVIPMFQEIWHYTYEAKDRSETLTELGEELGVA
tara:strand:- start:333 stop:569 length:237 start_codon:yes stop_codon:yes gene_type:complete